MEAFFYSRVNHHLKIYEVAQENFIPPEMFLRKDKRN